jgi:hypothetical protein
MKAQYPFVFFLVLVVILIVAALGTVGPMGETPALAQQAGEGESPTQDRNAPSVDITPTMSYQGRLVENGSPVTGSRSMTFRLFDAASGGTLYWEEGPKMVSVSNGLFTVTLGDTTPFNVDNFAQQLYLEITVASTKLPRQVLQGAPYALSLAPGADVVGTTGSSLVYAGNSGGGEGLKGYSYSGNGVSGSSFTGHGMYAESTGSGVNGSALYAKSTSSGGVALMAHNDAETSTDAAMILSNDGSGDLLKGFGGDSGEDEFRFKNDGTFQDKAPSYLFVPGANAYFNYTSSGATMIKDVGVTIYADTTGTKTFCLAVNLPAVLYGQPVKIEQFRTIYYTESSQNYIWGTFLTKHSQTGSYTYLVSNNDVYNSTTLTSYDYYPSWANTLSSDDGFITICYHVVFEDINYEFYFLGARLKLRHHPLY